uniref:Succinate dehydrogenase subunit 3 n=1 Tax=Symphyocladia marchantioides TaxID=88360 RepID=UPI0022FD6AF5|nr:Succinate dehydrogenase subunit 3 [Symphyocladia marchantioides]WAX04050.1 Succinate dehydrogenase subunit 3 [Symphyocladia marchantioides]
MLLYPHFYSLKPFSPHLTIYLNQLSSIFSIFHRFSALLILILIFIFLSFYLFSSNLFLYNFLIFNYLLSSIFYFFCMLIFKLGIFHILNGVKVIFWNFTYFKNFNVLTFFNKLIGIFFFFLLLF